MLSVILILLPSRLHWSRDSRGVLAAAGLALVGAGLAPDASMRDVNPILAGLSRNRELVVGATLLGVQYLLTEEDSMVRGSIAGLGGGLMGIGFLAQWCRAPLGRGR